MLLPGTAGSVTLFLSSSDHCSFFVFHQQILKTKKAFSEFLLINNSLLLENNVSKIKF